MVMRVPDGCEYYSRQAAPLDLDDLTADFAFRFGQSYASYLATEDGWETFVAPRRLGVVRFVRRFGWYAITVGGLLAQPADQPLLLEQFRKFLELNGLTGMFINLGPEELTPFRNEGFEVTKFGEEPLIPLATTTWQGKDYEWVRRQENYCKRQGLLIEEVTPNPLDPVYRDTIVPELTEISRQHVAATVQGWELRYCVGRFTPLELGQRRLFVVRSASRIEAFIVCNPCRDGQMWAIEIYRKRDDAPRGVVPFAMLQTLRLLKQEGVAHCSLSAVPMVRCEEPLEGDSWVVRQICSQWWNYGNWIFDMRGIYHFKSRFRPEYRNMYLAAWPRASLISMVALGRAWGILKVNPLRLAMEWCQQLAKRGTRKTLAEPEQASDSPALATSKRAA